VPRHDSNVRPRDYHAAEVVAAKLSTQPDSQDPQMLLDTLRAFDAVAYQLAGITS
jgi:hypothetical protein